MLPWLWTIPALPFAGFLLLVLTGARLRQRAAAWIGAGSVGLAFLVALAVAAAAAAGSGATLPYSQTLGRWIDAGGLHAAFSLYLDALSLLMILVISGVGFLIHLYSVEYMSGEDGYCRFFCCMNLFVASMLVLVLARDLLFLFLGWEGVGLCSYLLIGFWYRDPRNGAAACKAFIVTRIGDAAMAVGLFPLFTRLGTSDIPALAQAAGAQWMRGDAAAVAAAMLLLGGAVGKSAQLPLQTWLPDAMAGPTPVSALIHAATMVTAGVYLIARLHALYDLAPLAEAAVAVIGASTLLLAGCSALVQTDIKRVLAYSTISQIGYMFLALGVGAWQAAMFHFLTHACFKALLFLAAGVVIHAMGGEQNILRMGGLRRRLPLAFWSSLVGGASLAALPLITAGFYSKDLILWFAWDSQRGAQWLWLAGWTGALLTSVYTFRMLFLVFFGAPASEQSRRAAEHAGPAVRIPLLVLSVLSIVAGFVETPRLLGNITLFSRYIAAALPDTVTRAASPGMEAAIEALAIVASLGGLYAAFTLFIRRPQLPRRLAERAAGLVRWWRSDWAMDALYDAVLVRPYVALARINRRDVVDAFYDGVARAAAVAHGALSRSENGFLRWYAAGLGAGAVILIAIGTWGRT